LLREAWLNRELRGPVARFKMNLGKTGLVGSQVPTQAKVNVCGFTRTFEPGRGVVGSSQIAGESSADQLSVGQDNFSAGGQSSVGQSSVGQTSVGQTSRIPHSTSIRYYFALKKNGLLEARRVHQKCGATRRG